MVANGKSYGEGNVHVARMRGQAAKLNTEELVALYPRLPAVKGRFSTRQMIVRHELESRNLSLRDLGLDAVRV